MCVCMLVFARFSILVFVCVRIHMVVCVCVCVCVRAHKEVYSFKIFSSFEKDHTFPLPNMNSPELPNIIYLFNKVDVSVCRLPLNVPKKSQPGDVLVLLYIVT